MTTSEVQPKNSNQPTEPNVGNGKPARSRRRRALEFVLVAGVLGLIIFLIVTGYSKPEWDIREAEIAEGEQLMGSARDALNHFYAQTGSTAEALENFKAEQAKGAFAGMWYEVDPNPHMLTDDNFDVEVTCSPTREARSLAHGSMRFTWSKPESKVVWK